jgi:SAM-dependent methyltransferase
LHDTNRLPRRYFRRYDESDDGTFYTQPRLTSHIDAAATASLQGFLRHRLPTHSRILDLMSSYLSHMPHDVPQERIVGLGMNAEEMRQNDQLDDYVLHDLNRNPRLPFEDASFDAAVCTVSVQYLTHPIEVFADVGRVLCPGAPFIVSFSNRCFPSKAVQIWLTLNENQRVELVQMYFLGSHRFTNIQPHNLSPSSCRLWGDPLYAVMAHRLADM